MKEEKIKIKSEMDGLVLDCLLIEPDKEIEQLRKANEQYLEKLNKLKELLG